jgi:peptidoglycan/LPS O-acetylase OafA/YrhL
MNALIATAIVVISLALAPGTYRFLKSWRARRRSAWQLDRAAWRLWMLRP